MSWIVALVCLLVGAVAGAISYKLFKSDEARVQLLETQLQQLTNEYENYKREVHGHFSDSAHLFGKLTESYRDVFQHLAHGARNLCPEYIANQVVQIPSAEALINPDPRLDAEGKQLSPPLDYVVTPKDEPNPAPSVSGDVGMLGRS